MTEKNTIILSDVSIKGDLVEKDKIIIDAKINGNISADTVITHEKSKIQGNIKAKDIQIGGELKGNLNSDKIKLNKTSEVEGTLNQKKLVIDEGATLKIKAETYK